MASPITAFIETSLTRKTEHIETTKCEKISKLTFIISTFGLMGAASSANFYNAPTVAFCSRKFPNAKGFTINLFEITNGMTISSIWAGVYIDLLLSPSLTPSEKDILLPKDRKMQRTLLKVLSIVLGLGYTFPSILDRRLTPFEAAIQMFTQSGLFAYSLHATFNLLSQTIESSPNIDKGIELFFQSIAFRMARINRRLDVDPRIDLCRSLLVERLQENILFFSRSPKERKLGFAQKLKNAKQTNLWITEALKPFHHRTEVGRIAQIALTTLSTPFFAGSQLYLIHQLIANQINTTVNSHLTSNLLALIPAYGLAPIVYELIGESLDSFFSFIRLLFEGNSHTSVAETVAPHLTFRLKGIYAICSLLSWAQTAEQAYELDFSILWQVIMSISMVLLVTAPGLSAIEETGKVVFSSKDPDQITNPQEQAIFEEKMLLIETESDLIRLLNVLKYCSPNQLYQFIQEVPQPGPPSGGNRMVNSPATPLLDLELIATLKNILNPQ